MARYTGADCRLCRREGLKLFLKGTRCYTEKCALSKRAYAPGQHGAGGKRGGKLSNYGVQLREKQKVKRMYGVLEKQFKRYFSIASRTKGITGKILLQLLERRLDNVLYQAGFALSRDQARQMVSHGWTKVNRQRVTVPSYSIKSGDEIEIKAKSKGLEILRQNLKIAAERSRPAWLGVDGEKFSAKILRLPEKEDIRMPIEEQLIVELYSK
ncbi:MAG: 30S ribosomal protein S4 [Omnitrophica WOR_2 bacterium GWB2_45_9]|nr:MAG: 30S ribosomal protein S4 [Omnitrophica WOR_2 bacterium GWB2_45_9]OGX45688.1 MAG: 30S ribosomal protein S4 [Omnitrophica WOR_2 bacterium RIFOXYA2_FULL_45_12]OGX53953.1 MAG: 30S ribosomal protein S4 [Omnitrophica WOR_2 bacterium RIFOXYB2_FULL_45_11]OGX61246.1 MAG: 30S ribosomal protein S4 [Omnitrophica WOR_2 bacterium RIFOXYC2_FULL_45_15]HBU08088.1 30S ribosomal protein S4 [Candidatus Omnitrophota bacterium]